MAICQPHFHLPCDQTMNARFAKIVLSSFDRRLTGIVSYLSAGILLHVITAIELAIILVVAAGMQSHPLKVAILVLLGLYTLFTQLDARSRFQEYKKARDQLIRHGPDNRIFRSLSRSRCQRDAALAAARQLGYDRQCRRYFAAGGYRWFHLLPEFVSRQPAFLLSPAFLRATFFMPTYHSRYPAIVDRDGEPPGTPVGRRCPQHSHCS
jgi:hypothetical protein